jgi:MFS family permease
MSGPQPARAPSSSRYAWYVVAFLTLAATVSIIDRQILALMIGPVRQDLGVSDTMMGLLGGLAFTLFYTVFTWPMAWLADRGPRRNVIGLGIFFWSLATIACGMTGQYWQLFSARMAVGLGEAALYPSAISMLSDYFNRTRLPLAIGIFSAAPFFGIGLANILGGLVIHYLAGSPTMTLPLFGTVRSWQGMFIIVGAPGTLLAILALTIREPLRTGRAQPVASANAGAAQTFDFFRQRSVFLVLLFSSLIALAIQAWAFFFWIVELLVREHHASRSVVGVSFGFSALVFGTLGSVSAGLASGRMMRAGKLDATLRLSLLSTIILIPVGIATPMVAGFGPTMVLVSLSLFLMGWPGGLLTAAMQLVVPNEFRGRMVALYFIFVNFISLSCGPLLGGFISDHLFGGKALGETIALMAAIDYPIAAVLIWKCMPRFRQALVAARAWQETTNEQGTV